MSTEQTPPNPEDFGKLGISCPYGEEAVDTSYEYNATPAPNGKHRWSYYCKDPESGKTGEKQYTDWIYD